MVFGAKEAMDREWIPQKDGCFQTMDLYLHGRAAHVQRCAPPYYDRSCEKACIEQQHVHAGCGVIEGSQPNDLPSLGGVAVTCSPPSASWLLGHVKETKGDQCARITAWQPAHGQYAQQVIKAGWLWKKGNGWFSGWDKRYFVLESGDSVRSALMRYFDDVPKSAVAKEKADKDIILWDAKGVRPDKTPGKFSDTGAACFVIEHFYRDYHLCVVPADSALGVDADREEWMNLIRS